MKNGKVMKEEGFVCIVNISINEQVLNILPNVKV